MKTPICSIVLLLLPLYLGAQMGDLENKIRKESLYYALIIGVNDYQDEEVADLANPLIDAQLIYDVLTTEYTFAKDNTWLIKNPTRSDLIMVFDSIQKTVTPNDHLLIFYAGHSIWDPGKNLCYWLPADVSRNSKMNWLRNSTLAEDIRNIPAKHILLIADACFSELAIRTEQSTGEADIPEADLFQFNSRRAILSGIIARVPDQSSFTKNLIALLHESDLSLLSSRSLYNEIRTDAASRGVRPPVYGEIIESGDEGGDFLFLRRE